MYKILLMLCGVALIAITAAACGSAVQQAVVKQVPPAQIFVTDLKHDGATDVPSAEAIEANASFICSLYRSGMPMGNTSPLGVSNVVYVAALNDSKLCGDKEVTVPPASWNVVLTN